jgi:uncharacterized membrane protein
MILLILGVLLWSSAHVLKRLAPDMRARLGPRGNTIIAMTILASVVLMVIGYRTANGPILWDRSPARVGLNNLLMILSIYLFAASGAKTWITSKVKNPQLTAMKVWALAHLLVNGALEDLVLFGGLMAWAVATVIILKRSGATREPYHAVGMKKEITAGIATLVVMGVAMGVHVALGVQPWG